jgi:hypothetical protein
MTKQEGRYLRVSSPMFLYCGKIKGLGTLIRDEGSWEEFTEETINTYLAEGSEIFIRMLRDFASESCIYQPIIAKELRFMLEALIEVKEVFKGEHQPAAYKE